MRSAQTLLRDNSGRIHITHKTKPPFGTWDLVKWGNDISNSLTCVGSVIFDRVNYPGYVNKKALKKDSFPSFDAEQYILIVSPLLANCGKTLSFKSVK